LARISAGKDFQRPSEIGHGGKSRERSLAQTECGLKATMPFSVDHILHSLIKTKAESNYERFPQTERFPHVPRQLAHVALVVTCGSMRRFGP
jgi:hypothetical protein